MAESRAGSGPEVDPGVDRVPTDPEDVRPSRLRRARALRRLFFLLLCALLAAAALGLLGVRTDEATASGGGYELVVKYPSIIRPGLGTHLTVEVRREGGFSRIVTLAARSDYFDIFDEHGFDPDPIGVITDEERIVWTFEPPRDADAMTVSFDARLEPGVQLKRVPGFFAVLDNDREVARVRVRTVVLP